MNDKENLNNDINNSMLDDFNFDDDGSESKLDSSLHIINNGNIYKGNMVLYVLTDRPKSNLLSYFRTAGLPVSRIFSSIKNLRDTILMMDDTCRIIVMDTGLGKFTNMGARQDLMDMIGICDDDIKITVFYTDSAVQVDAKESDNIDHKKIQWYKYKSTADTVAKMLLLKEKYDLSANADSIDTERLVNALDSAELEFKGVTCDYTSGVPSITTDDIMEHMGSQEYEHLRKFKVKY